MSTGYDFDGGYDAGIGYDGATLFSPPVIEERFSTPYVYEPFGTFNSLWSRLSRAVGLTVWKDATGWHSQTSPLASTLNAALVVAYDSLPGGENGQYIFLGGHIYGVSPEIAAELVAAGFTVG